MASEKNCPGIMKFKNHSLDPDNAEKVKMGFKEI